MRIFFIYICQNTPNMNIDQRHIYHYGSQGIRDEGWGCVYRNIQTMRAMNNMTIPTISTMQADIGIDPRGQGRALWIEPVDARRYFPPNNKLVLYTTAPNPESYMLRTKLSDFDRVLRSTTDTDAFLSRCLANKRQVLIDDSVYSYLLVNIIDGLYIYVDPHRQQHHVQSMTRDEFFNHKVWMMLC